MKVGFFVLTAVLLSLPTLSHASDSEADLNHEIQMAEVQPAVAICKKGLDLVLEKAGIKIVSKQNCVRNVDSGDGDYIRKPVRLADGRACKFEMDLFMRWNTSAGNVGPAIGGSLTCFMNNKKAGKYSFFAFVSKSGKSAKLNAFTYEKN